MQLNRTCFASNNLQHYEPGIISMKNAVSIVEKLLERMGGSFPIVKVFANAFWSALRTIFRPKMH